MSNIPTKTGTTLSGFSRAGFGCCARHSTCEMGKGTCYYAQTDVEVPMLCAAYKRHHITTTPSIVIPTIEAKIVETVTIATETYDEDDDGQFSLF